MFTRSPCPRRPRAVLAAFLASCLLSSPSHAITSRDVTEKMSKEERVSYISGLVDMLSYQWVLQGDRTHAVCVSDAFYKNERTMKLLLDALYRYPDKAPEGVVIVVMKQVCGG